MGAEDGSLARLHTVPSKVIKACLRHKGRIPEYTPFPVGIMSMVGSPILHMLQPTWL